ncbi:peptidyl-prolyl cis-trans isomerase [Candidatus Marsarchaeota archaeon]|nr:peptidyl-prolyl cis-trans isomerase [Candidatus Marsarchaeota archaeon]
MTNQIRCAHILVEKESVAKDILERIKKGESFAKLAEQYSTDGSRRHGGDLGFFGKGMMVKPFEDAAFALEKGQVSGVVRTQFGYHIIKRTS